MLPLSEEEIDEIKAEFCRFDHRLDDNNVLITMDDMASLLWQLSKTHSETDSKTLFNELEISEDGSGWILDLPTFMVLMLHNGANRRLKQRQKKHKTFTSQWRHLHKSGHLISTEISIEIPTKGENLKDLLQSRMYERKSFENSSSKCIKYPNYQSEYGVEFPPKKCIYSPAAMDDNCSSNSESNAHAAESKVGFEEDEEGKMRIESHTRAELPPSKEFLKEDDSTLSKRCCPCSCF